jgi:hypothetical protein
MKTDYIAETETEPRIRAWLIPAENDDEIEDPRVPRRDGWRLIVEYVDGAADAEPIRSAWDHDIETVILTMEDHWEERPIWKIYQTGAIVDLYAILGVKWKPGHDGR